MTAGTLALYLLGLYVAAGIGIAVAFVIAGVGRVLPQAESAAPMGFSVGARLLLIPGATLLWPYVLLRWVRSRR